MWRSKNRMRNCGIVFAFNPKCKMQFRTREEEETGGDEKILAEENHPAQAEHESNGSTYIEKER